MIWADTSRHITPMQDAQSWRNGAMGQFPRQSVRHELPVRLPVMRRESKQPVASDARAPLPQPAALISTLTDFDPKQGFNSANALWRVSLQSLPCADSRLYFRRQP